jgi:hypothetical protein
LGNPAGGCVPRRDPRALIRPQRFGSPTIVRSPALLYRVGLILRFRFANHTNRIPSAHLGCRNAEMPMKLCCCVALDNAFARGPSHDSRCTGISPLTDVRKCRRNANESHPRPGIHLTSKQPAWNEVPSLPAKRPQAVYKRRGAAAISDDFLSDRRMAAPSPSRHFASEEQARWPQRTRS